MCLMLRRTPNAIRRSALGVHLAFVIRFLSSLWYSLNCISHISQHLAPNWPYFSIYISSFPCWIHVRKQSDAPKRNATHRRAIVSYILLYKTWNWLAHGASQSIGGIMHSTWSGVRELLLGKCCLKWRTVTHVMLNTEHEAHALHLAYAMRARLHV